MMKPKIYLSPPHIGEQELTNVQKAFASNWIAPVGPFIDEFEIKLAQYCNTKSVVAVQSGTAAIHLALQLIGIEQNDLVLCQSFTFVGTSNPILYQGGTPIFIDSEENSWNMCPIALKNALEELDKESTLPKAIIVVHLYGMPAQMEAIMDLANTYQIPVIEDAAEALGSSIKGKPCGSFGDFGVLSFNGNKIITTSGGGALLSNDEKAIKEARFLATQAKDDETYYAHSKLGYNYRLSNISAAIGVGQLAVIEERVANRRKNFQFYQKSFEKIPGISFLEEPDGYFSNRWLSCILIDPNQTGGISCEDIRLELAKDNIESRPLWKPLHSQVLYKHSRFFGTNCAEKLFQKGLCLPSGSNLSQEDKERISSHFHNLFYR